MKLGSLLTLAAMMSFPFIGNDLSGNFSQTPFSEDDAVIKEITVSVATQTPSNELESKPNFASIEDVNKKKAAFFGFLRPHVEAENARISTERTALHDIGKTLATGESIPENQQQFATTLSENYQHPLAEEGITQQWLAEMLTRVNYLPESLILTQAANESAWGTSRFAVEANNFFGQWCYSQGCGLIPEKRVEGASHEVAKFSGAQQSVRAYFMNINRNQAYKELRDIRAQLSQSGDSLSDPDAAIALTQGLLRYSERGQDYVDELQSMIRFNSNYWI
jgi:Bax protein